MTPAPERVDITPRGEAPSRAPFWDVARGLGIVLVVYGHVARGLMAAGILPNARPWANLDTVIYSFHMPLFFFISGHFFPASYAKWGPLRLMRQKLGTIAYPYVCWSLLQGTVEYALAGITNHGARPAVSQILFTPIDQFWFLYALFFIVALGTAVYALRVHAPWILLVISLVFFFADMSEASWVGFGYVGYYLLFFSLGATTAHFCIPRPAPSNTQSLLIGLLSFAALMSFNRLSQSDLSHSLFWLQRSIALGCALSGLILIFSAARLFSGRLAAAFSLLGRRSMQIYVLHILSASGARILLVRLLGLHDAGLQLFVGLTAGLLLPVLVAEIAFRFGAQGIFEWPRRSSGPTLMAGR